MKKVKCTDTKIPRIDGKGACTGITEGKIYKVIGGKQHMYRIINDEGQAANYLKIRFEDHKVKPENNFLQFFGHCIVHWKSGGKSDVVIGQYVDGESWVACANWTGVKGEMKVTPLKAIESEIKKIRKVR